jgi:hypothetical protein
MSLKLLPKRQDKTTQTHREKEYGHEIRGRKQGVSLAHNGNNDDGPGRRTARVRTGDRRENPRFVDPRPRLVEVDGIRKGCRSSKPDKGFPEPRALRGGFLEDVQIG